MVYRLFQSIIPFSPASIAPYILLSLINLNNPPPLCFNSKKAGNKRGSSPRKCVTLWGFKTSNECFAMLSRRKTLGNRERFDRKKSNNIVHKDIQFVPATLLPATLYLCDLTPYTLHLTPYILTFSFFHFSFFGLSQSSRRKMAGAGGDALPACSCYFFCLFTLLFFTRGDTSRRAGPHPPLSPRDVATPGYGASRRRSVYAACRWVCCSPRR